LNKRKIKDKDPLINTFNSLEEAFSKAIKSTRGKSKSFSDTL